MDPLVVFKFVVEMAVFIGIYYYLLKFFKNTRAAQALTGLLVVFGGFWLLSILFDLEILNWALRQLSVWLVLGLVILFAPEIRRALANLGLRNSGRGNSTGSKALVDNVVEATKMLAERKIGALVAIERETGLKGYTDQGTPLDSAVTPQLLASIFYPQAPLHDGGVIIAGNRIAAAGCLFPLTDQTLRGVGTRHRAGLGLSEESDALVLIVSEETGTISLAYKGKLVRGLDEERLRNLMEDKLVKRVKEEEKEDVSAAPEPVEEEVA